MLEAKMKQLGFSKLQEKEDLIFFEKTGDEEQTFIIFDKNDQKIRSIDVYSIHEDRMSVKQNKNIDEIVRYIKNSRS